MIIRVLVDMVFKVHEMQQTKLDGHLPGPVQAVDGLQGKLESSIVVYFYVVRTLE